MFKVIWDFQIEKKNCRSKFCCNIEDREAEMIDVKQDFLDLKF